MNGIPRPSVAADGRGAMTTIPNAQSEVGTMDEVLDPREVALRQLPMQYSLALRLRDAAVSNELICDYLTVEADELATLFQVADAKLAAAQQEQT